MRTSPAPQEAGFRIGTSSSSLTLQTVYTNDLLDSASGAFSADVSSLSPSTTYYYQAFMTVSDGSGGYTEIVSSVRSFTTSAPAAVVDRGYLDCYEIPAVSVLTHDSAAETFGSTRYHAYTTAKARQMVVTHTFDYSGTKRNYSLLYDGDKHAALWVAFAMHADGYPWLVSRSDSWKADPAIPSSWQPNLSSGYQESSTYSRGHQVASNDRRTTTDQQKQTTYFSNMTPQISGFNGGVWATLEGDIQKIGNATTASDTLYVVTGPVFGAGFGTTPDKDGLECAVPTQYFKCIMKVSFSGSTPTAAVGAAYLMNHASSAARQEVTIDYIESLTGFDFFTNVPAALQNAAEAETHPTSYFPQKATTTSE